MWKSSGDIGAWWKCSMSQLVTAAQAVLMIGYTSFAGMLHWHEAVHCSCHELVAAHRDDVMRPSSDSQQEEP
jgi:hypothetical protein